MNAQDIWNTYRQTFKLDDNIRGMILNMKSGDSNILAKNMQSSGLLGMEMLLSTAYNEQQYDLCEFLLENGAKLNCRVFIPNPTFTDLNNLLSKYKIHDKRAQEFYNDLRQFITNTSQLEYTKDNHDALNNIYCKLGF
jgi:hypothetical protein